MAAGLVRGQKCLEYLEANIRGVLIRRESGGHLLVWMNVISKIPQPVTKFLHVRFKQADFTGNIYKHR